MKRELEPSLQMPAPKKLYEVLANLSDTTQVADFLRDVLTLEEIEEASRRLLIAENLKKGKGIRLVAREFGVSTTTVSRINYWLHHGTGGYDLALTKLK